MKYVTWNSVVNIGIGQMHKLVLNYTNVLIALNMSF